MSSNYLIEVFEHKFFVNSITIFNQSPSSLLQRFQQLGSIGVTQLLWSHIEGNKIVKNLNKIMKSDRTTDHFLSTGRRGTEMLLAESINRQPVDQAAQGHNSKKKNK